MSKPEDTPQDVIESMCLTWRHDFGLMPPPADKDGRVAWSDGFPMGMTQQQQKDGLRLQMRQLYQHHVLPAIMAATLAEREACALLADPPLAHRVGNVGLWRKRRAAIAAAIRKRDVT